jgi:BolA protein
MKIVITNFILYIFIYKMIKFIFKNFTTRYNRIKDIITKTYQPIYFDLVNESHMHNVPENAETHFKLTIVSKDFDNKNTVNIHRDIYKLLESEMGEKRDSKLHALSIVAKTEKQWEMSQGVDPSSSSSSPDCVFKKKL